MGPERHFTTFECSPSHDDAVQAVHCRPRSDAGVGLELPNRRRRGQVPSRPAVRQARGQGRVSSIAVIQHPNSKDSRQSDPVLGAADDVLGRFGLPVDVSAERDDEVRGKGLLAKREVMATAADCSLGKPLHANPGERAS